MEKPMEERDHDLSFWKKSVLDLEYIMQVRLRETINKWNLLILKSFCKAKDMVNKTK